MIQTSSDSLSAEVFLATCKEKILSAIERGESAVHCVGGGNDFLDALSAKFGHLLGNELRFWLTDILVKHEADIFAPHVAINRLPTENYQVTFRW